MQRCPACHCHVLRVDSGCPHCGAALTAPAPRSRAGATALSAGLAMLACTTDTGPGDTAASTMMTESSGTDTATVTGTETDTETETDETSADTGTSTSETDTDAEAGEPDYGVPSIPCDFFEPEPAIVGSNSVTVGEEPLEDLFQSCGGQALELYTFTVSELGDYEIALPNADFPGVISLYIGDLCSIDVERSCALAPESITVELAPDIPIHVAVGSTDLSGGDAQLTITPQQ